MGKLTIKELAPYLPYGLKIQHNWEKARHGEEKELRPWTKVLEPWQLCSIEKGFKWKPLLRPLSQLTEEIEHNGEIFEPRRELFLAERKFLTERDNVISIEWGKKEPNHFKHLFYHAWRVSMKYRLRNGQETSMVGTFSMREMEYQQWQLLFEWHFDVFGLIEKGLAIEISK